MSDFNLLTSISYRGTQSTIHGLTTDSKFRPLVLHPAVTYLVIVISWAAVIGRSKVDRLFSSMQRLEMNTS